MTTSAAKSNKKQTNLDWWPRNGENLPENGTPRSLPRVN